MIPDSLSGYMIVNDEGEHELFNDYEAAVEAAQNNDEQSWTIVYFEAITTDVETVATVTHD